MTPANRICCPCAARLCILVALLAGAPQNHQAASGEGAKKETAGRAASVTVAFGNECHALLIREIERARTEVLVAIYSITSKNIASALAQAAERGLKVRVKYDAESFEYEGMKHAIGYMKKRGVECTPIEMSEKYAKMHNKFTIVDRSRVLTGSCNYTAASTASHENVILVESVEIAEAFVREFEKIATH